MSLLLHEKWLELFNPSLSTQSRDSHSYFSLFEFAREQLMPVSDNQDAVLQLPQNLTVRAISAVQQEMLQFIDKNTSTTIELPEDGQVDISFLQVMEAARIYANTAGKYLALASPASGPTLDVLQRSGLLEGFSAADQQFWLHQEVIQ